MPTIGEWLAEQGGRIDTLSASLGEHVRRIVPARLRRIVEKMQTRRQKPYGQIAAISFLGATILYGLVAGGHLGTLLDRVVTATFFGIDRIEIAGNRETPELVILERLDIAGGSLIGFDAEAARDRLTDLPWVKAAEIRKFYPNRLDIALVERVPYALWQNEEVISLIDKDGVVITAYDDVRFSGLPFLVGRGANERAPDFLAALDTHPDIARRVRSSVLVSERRWNLVTDNGITVQLPEGDVDAALDRLERLEAEDEVFAREILVIDLRLKDRVRFGLNEAMAEAIMEENESVIRRLAKAGGAI
ncbi:cell division protein FtsQ/DivIB [Afifella pfennigii]|uniref:cell division protein FtsQ/DivIB n=1 Tax=Afifella pfennigii TaxID=209897 RepID=UPI000691065C|nr:cell division protein FtsQ/DivIB [Afifella pfennigii]